MQRMNQLFTALMLLNEATPETQNIREIRKETTKNNM